jgi:type I restriction enzyme S subunit
MSTNCFGSDSYVSTENMLQNFGGRTEVNAFPTNTNVNRYNLGDVLLSNIRPYLKKIWLADREGGCSSDVIVLNHNNLCNGRFLYYLLANDSFVSYVMSGAKGLKMPRGDKQHIFKYELSIPSRREQEKISSFLRILDERIQTQKKIIEDLKKLKDAIAEKLFCSPDNETPELRIANSSVCWNLYRLKDVCQRISERNSQESSSLVLTIAAQYGLVSQTDFFNKSVASENLSNYYLIQKGDFAYNKSYSGEYPWGAVKRLELYEKGVLSPLYICFRPNPLIVNSDFLSHYFETHKWHNGIAQVAGEGARNHGLLNVSISDYFATLHRLPGLPEQKKIASYLNLLSDKMSLVNKELQCYSRQKQYLLARMFI